MQATSWSELALPFRKQNAKITVFPTLNLKNKIFAIQLQKS